MSEEKITYLLGAGASVGAFPLVKESEKGKGNSLADELVAHGQSLSRHKKYLLPDEKKTLDRIRTAMIMTGEKANLFGNVDSYAKYLYHKGQDTTLKDLKLALTYFFVARQVCNKENIKEKRYLNLITSIIDHQHKFPKHVKVISWNYDFLFETAGSLYKAEKIEKAGNSTDYESPFVSYYPFYNSNQFNISNDSFWESFSLVHLNGIAGLYIQDAKGNNFNSMFHDLGCIGNEKRFSEVDLIKKFHVSYMQSDNLLTFAWEVNSTVYKSLSKSYEVAEKVIKGTTILVVIGYSFPFYNREIDNKLFDAIEPTLTKIYFQDPYNDGEFLRTRYKLFHPDSPSIRLLDKPVSITHINNTDQFFIPVEL